MKLPLEDGSMLVFSQMERRADLYICLFFEMGRVIKLVFYELERREEGAFICACILWKYSYRCHSYIEQ